MTRNVPMLSDGFNFQAGLTFGTVGYVFTMSCRVCAAWACYTHLEECAVCLKTDLEMMDM